MKKNIELIDLLIFNGYSKDDIIYFLNSKNSIKKFKDSTSKEVYEVKGTTHNSNLIVKKWYESGKYRDIKNCIKGGSRGLREAKNTILLSKNGIGAPIVISFGSYKKKNSSEYVSFNITQRVDKIRTYYEIAKEFYNNRCPEKSFYLQTERISSEIAKMHLAGITHHDLHAHNILIQTYNTDISVFFLDNLAIKKHLKRCFYPLIDIAKFYYWMKNDPSGLVIADKESEYILREYYKRARDIYPFGYIGFKRLVVLYSVFIKKTYNITKSIRNIQ